MCVYVARRLLYLRPDAVKNSAPDMMSLIKQPKKGQRKTTTPYSRTRSSNTAQEQQRGTCFLVVCRYKSTDNVPGIFFFNRDNTDTFTRTRRDVVRGILYIYYICIYYSYAAKHLLIVPGGLNNSASIIGAVVIRYSRKQCSYHDRKTILCYPNSRDSYLVVEAKKYDVSPATRMYTRSNHTLKQRFDRSRQLRKP